MAISVVDSQQYEGGYITSHTMTDFDASGTDTYALEFSFNKNPASDVTSRTFEGSTPTARISATNANVCSVIAFGELLNNAAVTCVTGTSSYKEEAMIGVGLAGVDQTAPLASTYSPGSQWGNTPNVSRTGTLGNWFVVSIAYKSNVTLTPSAGMTVQEDISTANSLGQCWVGYVECTGSAQTIGATSSASDNYEIIVLEVAAATAAAGIEVTPTTLAVAITENAPTASLSDNQKVTPTTLATVATGSAPTVTASDAQEVTPTTLAASISTSAPTVTASDNQSVTPTALATTIAAYAPTVTAAVNISAVPTTLSVTTTEYAPTVTATDNQEVTPTTLAVVTTGEAPSIIIGDSIEATPGSLAQTITTFAPAVTPTAHTEVAPNTLALVFTGYASVVTIREANISVTPTTLSLVLTGYTPIATTAVLLEVGTGPTGVVYTPGGIDSTTYLDGSDAVSQTYTVGGVPRNELETVFIVDELGNFIVDSSGFFIMGQPEEASLAVASDTLTPATYSAGDMV